jgi:heme A synthase
MSGTGSVIVRRPQRLRALAIASMATTLLLVGVGGLVRATGSGLGCPGWPRCFGRWIPPLEYHAVIEYAHRLVASIDVVMIGLLAGMAWRRYRDVPRVFVSSVGAFGVVLAQAALGAVVVEGELAALLVTAHFATAMVLVAVLVYAVVASYTIDRRPDGRVDRLTAVARVTAGATFALLLVGAYVRGEGAGLVFNDWPLMDGRLIPPLGSMESILHFAHRALTLVLAVLVGSLAARAWRARSERRPAAVLAVVAAVLLVGQVMAGAANVWTGLAAPAVVAHVMLAAMVWGALVATALVARALPEQPPETVAESVRPAAVRSSA